MGSLKLYGVPLSQPFRSVAWALLQKRVPFQVAMAVPGMTGKVGARSPDFLARVNPLGAIPAIEEEESGFVVFESPAILTYLAETRGDAFTDMYPSPGDPQARATINAFMSWHHGGTRQLARLVQPFLRPDLGEVDEAVFAARVNDARAVLATLSSAWLRDGRDAPFIGGSATPTFADLLAYEEVYQLPALGLLAVDDEYPVLAEWCARMARLPGHAAAHAALDALGDLRGGAANAEGGGAAPLPMGKRLGLATKAGMKALAEAQERDQRAEEGA